MVTHPLYPPPLTREEGYFLKRVANAPLKHPQQSEGWELESLKEGETPIGRVGGKKDN